MDSPHTVDSLHTAGSPNPGDKRGRDEVSEISSIPATKIAKSSQTGATAPTNADADIVLDYLAQDETAHFTMQSNNDQPNDINDGTVQQDQTASFYLAESGEIWVVKVLKDLERDHNTLTNKTASLDKLREHKNKGTFPTDLASLKTTPQYPQILGKEEADRQMELEQKIIKETALKILDQRISFHERVVDHLSTQLEFDYSLINTTKNLKESFSEIFNQKQIDSTLQLLELCKKLFDKNKHKWIDFIPKLKSAYDKIHLPKPKPKDLDMKNEKTKPEVSTPNKNLGKHRQKSPAKFDSKQKNGSRRGRDTTPRKDRSHHEPQRGRSHSRKRSKSRSSKSRSRSPQSRPQRRTGKDSPQRERKHQGRGNGKQQKR